MLVPAVADLRPGDAVKVRGTGHQAHTGGKAVVVAVHRSRTTPGAVDAVEVRYSARGAALRVDLHGPGEMVRFGDPWPVAAPVPHAPVTALAHADAPLPRRRVAVAGVTGVTAVAALLLLWPQDSPPPPAPGAPPTGAVEVVAAGRSQGPRGTTASTVSPTTASPTTSPRQTPSPSPTADGRVVAWSTGPVPVVALASAAPSPVPLAGIAEADGCHDAYAAELLRLLPVGTAVDVRGSGYLRTADGVDVNAELVRSGVAEPAPGATASAADQEGWASVTGASVTGTGAPSPARCR